jgi:hypothetical protein
MNLKPGRLEKTRADYSGHTVFYAQAKSVIRDELPDACQDANNPIILSSDLLRRKLFGFSERWMRCPQVARTGALRQANFELK